MTEYANNHRFPRWSLLVLPLFILPILITTGAGYPDIARADHAYVGVDGCKMCHRSAAKGNQFGEWEGSKHAKAFEALGSDKAKEIAADKGIGNPQEADECLVCHTTGQGGEHAATWKVEQGVGCESCHGAGADYNKFPIMRDSEQSLANGLVIPNEEICLKCHNDKSPTFVDFDFEEMSPKIAHPDPTKG